jgi:lysophospholipase L1-like esterase
MRVGDGHIKTKFFDSSTIVQTIDSFADLEFIDSSANCVLKINDGHIKTKNFNSKTLERTIDTKIAEAIAPLDPQTNILYNKKVVFLGDSITAGSGASSSSKVYHQIFGQLAHCTVVPLGVGDSCIANNTINGSGRDRSQFIKRINSSNLANVDLLIVFGGTNDFTYDSKPIGELYSEENISSNTYRGTVRRIAPSDTDTFAGALHELILYIRSINPNLPIIFMTPMNRGDFGSPTYPNWSESNTHGQFLQDY